MNILEVEDYEMMSRKAAEIVLDRVSHNPMITLGLATGGSPKRMYELIVEDFQKDKKPSFSNVVTFNLDEYIGVSPSHPNSYYYYMNKHLFYGIDINTANINIPNGIASDYEMECKVYDNKLDANGGIDLQILGIGKNGHIGFNEPGTSFSSGTHIVTLEESTRMANAKYFSSMEEVPEKAITMGIKSIMKSKEILLLVSGQSKEIVVNQLLEGEITENFPASVLRKHPNVTVIMDKAASGGRKKVI